MSLLGHLRVGSCMCCSSDLEVLSAQRGDACAVAAFLSPCVVVVIYLVGDELFQAFEGMWQRAAAAFKSFLGFGMSWRLRRRDLTVPHRQRRRHGSGLGSHILLHCDKEPLFGPQNSPKLTLSKSLGYSVEFQVRRRAPGRLDHGDNLVMDGLPNRSMFIALCLGCRFLG